MNIDLIIKNGTVVSNERVIETDIAINEEKIIAIGSSEIYPNAKKIIDAKNMFVLPGGIDPHCHFEIFFMGAKVEETWDEGSIASAIGGTTTTIDFAEQEKGKTLLDAVKKQFSRAEKLSAIDYTTTPILTDLTDIGKTLAGVKEVIDYGIPSFKGATIYRKVGWYEDDWQLYQVFRHIKKCGGLIMIHAENGLIGEGMQDELVHQGKTDPKYHGVAKPSFVENMAIIKCMILAEELQANVYICHCTTKESPNIINEYRKKGLSVYCETCSHYLVFTDEKYEPKFPNGIMYMASPPLRKNEDIEALWEAIKNGKVDTVGSDHDAFTKKQKEEKQDSFEKIPNGFPGCEVRLGILFSEGVLKRGLSLKRFAEVTATNAAKIFGIYPKKGIIAPGSDADIVIIDPAKKHSLNVKDLHMKTDLSIYEGMEVTGWPIMTILRGKVIVENEKFVGKIGQGEFVKGKL